MTATTLAVVDLGSNSFRLEIGRIEGGQIYRQDTWRETLRFGAGLDTEGRITAPAMKAALECLASADNDIWSSDHLSSGQPPPSC